MMRGKKKNISYIYLKVCFPKGFMTRRKGQLPLHGAPHWSPVSTHLAKQWAAVRIHWLSMREPPQKWLPLRCRLTCQGQSPDVASAPPTIRLLSGATPHTGGQRVKPLHFLFNEDVSGQEETRVKLTVGLCVAPCGGGEKDNLCVSVECRFS